MGKMFVQGIDEGDAFGPGLQQPSRAQAGSRSIIHFEGGQAGRRGSGEAQHEWTDAEAELLRCFRRKLQHGSAVLLSFSDTGRCIALEI